jgi:hypothetical protein
MIPLLIGAATLFSPPCPEVWMVFDAASLETALRGAAGDSPVWLCCPLPDSFEYEVFARMPPPLQPPIPLTLEEGKQKLAAAGFSLLYLTVEREIRIVSPEWVEQELFPRTGLPEEKRAAFTSAFCSLAPPFGLRRQLLVQALSSPPLAHLSGVE